MDHTVTYRFGRSDYIALLRMQRTRGLFGPLGRWDRYALFALLLVVLFNLLDVSSGSFDPPVALMTSGLAFAALFLAAPLGEFLGERALARWIFPRFSQANKDLTLTFGDDGIRSKYAGMEGTVPWKSVLGVLETDNCLYLPISRAEMIVVPGRALPSANAAMELAHYIRSKVAASATA
jgi:hypothetical protein